jgi:RNA polymerase sigma-70 factor (ECF subfamily)
LVLLLLAFLLNKRTSEEEIELIGRIVRKEEKALADLYDLYSKILFSIILRIVKSREDAEEILHGVFMQVWEKAGSFDIKKGNLYSWLITMARNRSIDRIRSKNFKAQYNKSGLNKAEEMGLEQKYNLRSDFDLHHMIDELDIRAIILNALNALPPEQKKVIELAYYDGLTQMEMSETLNIPLGTIKTRTRQALIKLEDLLSKGLKN